MTRARGVIAVEYLSEDEQHAMMFFGLDDGRGRVLGLGSLETS